MNATILECDVAIIGGGFGGCAAALAACETGARVILSEPTDWIGGQVTSQGVSALDEHAWIESFGGTRSYYRFRDGVRAAYREQYGQPAKLVEIQQLNPGEGWVSRLCFEPKVGLQVLQDMLRPYLETGQLILLLGYAPVKVVLHGPRIRQVTLSGPAGERRYLRADQYLDATELGDMLPLVKAPFVTGAESAADTGEQHALPGPAQPGRVQSFTMCFFVEYRPGENHTIRKPRGYETWRDTQPFTLTLKQRGGKERRFFLFDGDLAFWKYRRVFAADLFGSPGRPYDLALVNWDSNDYYKETLIDRSPAQMARILKEARRLSLSFLYWLQTEAPLDSEDGSSLRGCPGLRLAPEAAGTVDGLAKAPYIREGRRLLGYRRIVEQDIVETPGCGARAVHYSDSVGIGWYPIDLHRCVGDPTAGEEDRLDFPTSLPFQIPLDAMLSGAVENLIAAGKCIASTHITNGCYRVHPVEWNIGESAGALAAFCVAQNVNPSAIRSDMAALRAYQDRLLVRGIPLSWGVDVLLSDPDFPVMQCALLNGPPPRRTKRFASLQLLPDEPVSRREAAWLFQNSLLPAHNPALMKFIEGWPEAQYSPCTQADFETAFALLDRTVPPASSNPTLRELCRALY